jgi:putative heme-binding domain-containing protein
MVANNIREGRMRLNEWTMAASTLFVLAAGLAFAQSAPPVKNPKEGDSDAIRAGTTAYRARCASCHGADAKGSTGGCDLTSLWTAGGTDQQIFQSIRRGFPNTMKAHSFGPDDDIWSIMAYLRTLDTRNSSAGRAGNADNGERIFNADCVQCHQAKGQGGLLGPDLSRVGSSRSRAALAHKIRNASSYIMSVYTLNYIVEGYQPVTLVTRSGQRIRGVKKNEDAFSIQIMDTRERLQGYSKADRRAPGGARHQDRQSDLGHHD